MSKYKVGDFIVCNDPASNGKAYEVVIQHGEHYKIKSKDGIRFCREWRIERLATDEEIKRAMNHGNNP